MRLTGTWHPSVFKILGQNQKMEIMGPTTFKFTKEDNKVHEENNRRTF
jgi:hypothetical protein